MAPPNPGISVASSASALAPELRKFSISVPQLTFGFASTLSDPTLPGHRLPGLKSMSHLRSEHLDSGADNTDSRTQRKPMKPRELNGPPEPTTASGPAAE